MDDLTAALARFHQEILLPDMERIFAASEQRLRQEMHGLFDAIAQRLDRLETEYHMLSTVVKRIEERVERIEQRLDKMVLRSEFLELKTRVNELQERMRVIEAQIQD